MGLFKLLLFLAAAYILYKLVMGDRLNKQVDTKKEQEKRHAAGEMVKDPICGAYVDLESSIRVRDGETLHRFCSYDCRDAFLKQVKAREEPKAME